VFPPGDVLILQSHDVSQLLKQHPSDIWKRVTGVDGLVNSFVKRDLDAAHGSSEMEAKFAVVILRDQNRAGDGRSGKCETMISLKSSGRTLRTMETKKPKIQASSEIAK
jgi:hypothetical protein